MQPVLRRKKSVSSQYEKSQTCGKETHPSTTRCFPVWHLMEESHAHPPLDGGLAKKGVSLFRKRGLLTVLKKRQMARRKQSPILFFDFTVQEQYTY